jgi:hypothetical protein
MSEQIGGDGRRWIRPWWLASFAIALVLLGAFLAVALPRRSMSGITQANFDRIQEGMTVEEVEAILGCPAGDLFRAQERYNGAVTHRGDDGELHAFPMVDR